MQYLGEKSIDSVLIEGGGTLAYSALQAKIVNHIYSYIAPKIFGGENAKTPVESVGVEAPDDCFKLKEPMFVKWAVIFLSNMMFWRCSNVYRNYRRNWHYKRGSFWQA